MQLNHIWTTRDMAGWFSLRFIQNKACILYCHPSLLFLDETKDAAAASTTCLHNLKSNILSIKVFFSATYICSRSTMTSHVRVFEQLYCSIMCEQYRLTRVNPWLITLPESPTNIMQSPSNDIRMGEKNHHASQIYHDRMDAIISAMQYCFKQA